GMFGKWGLGKANSSGTPGKQGFNEFYGYLDQRNAHNYYPEHVYHNKKKVMLNGEKYSHDLIMTHALKFIRDNKDKPFFCYLPVTIPHAAMQVPEKYVAPFRKIYPQFEGKTAKYSGAKTITNPIACFAGMMAKLDEDTGRLLALLKELEIDENTIVIFTSDNGPHHEGGHDPEFWDSNGPLTGLKRSLTDGGIRVPTMARWPKHIKPNTVSDHLSAFWDFLPTACEIAGVNAPKAIDGISYLPTLLGKEQNQTHEYLYWEFNEQGGKKAVRLGNYKAVQTDIYKDKDAPIRLYDLQSDLGETKDISAKHPEVIVHIRAIMADQTPSKRFPVSYNPNYKRNKPEKKSEKKPRKKSEKKSGKKH
ncbi:MAG: sulfatase-like hydrolase/transferase, partial [Phycisphaerales bacterium]|nr:sulfatase-like hydrolase/transferase [Phycisphaerales bacterium]